MRGKKAKALRKLVYAKNNFRKRGYATQPNGMEINTADPIKFETPKKEKRQLALRRIYQRLKPMIKGLPNEAIKKAVLG